MKHFQVGVIGGGPAGYTAGIRLQQYGIKAVVFEKDRLGGVCLNWGCIPTKALVKAADLFAEVNEMYKKGVFSGYTKLDFASVMQYKDDAVEKLVSGIEYLYNKREIPVIKTEVKEIELDGNGYIIHTPQEDYACDYIILATGSKPKETGDLKFDGKQILSSRDLLALNEMPQSLAVIGGGVIGCEFASIFRQFGVELQIIEFLPELVALEDSEISKRLLVMMKKRKIKIFTNSKVESLEKLPDRVMIHLSSGKKLEAEKVLLSIGRSPVCNVNFKGKILEKSGDFVTIDHQMRTNIKNVFALGDLSGRLMLAHVASSQALLVCEIIKSQINGGEHNKRIMDYENIPRCTFTNPPLASVGLTEKQAKERYGDILIGKFMFSANGKALASGYSEGFVKVILEKKTSLLKGMHIIGPEAAELIAQGAVMINQNADISSLKGLVFAHPTLSEAVGEAVEDAEGLAVHKI